MGNIGNIENIDNIGNTDNIDNTGNFDQIVPVCNWGEYGPWSPCSATCGGGTQQRSRSQQFVPKFFKLNNNNNNNDNNNINNIGNNNNKCDSNEQVDTRKCQIGPCLAQSKLTITALTREEGKCKALKCCWFLE